jgi:hypothetical protein
MYRSGTAMKTTRIFRMLETDKDGDGRGGRPMRGNNDKEHW